LALLTLCAFQPNLVGISKNILDRCQREKKDRGVKPRLQHHCALKHAAGYLPGIVGVSAVQECSTNPDTIKICRLERAREEGEIRIAEDAMLAERAMLRGCEARSMRE